MRVAVHENQLKVLDRSSLVTDLLGSSMKASILIYNAIYILLFNLLLYKRILKLF